MDSGKTAARKHPRCSALPKLTNADKLLLLLMYYREYRPMFHIGVTYSISESRVCEIIKNTEAILIHDALSSTRQESPTQVGEQLRGSVLI